MSHTCDRCGETFGTLSRLRLHDCPGPDLEDGDATQAFVDQLSEGLERGDTVTTLPDGGLSVTDIDALRSSDGIETVTPQMTNPIESATERIAVLVETSGYVLEYFPWKGWVVVRTVRTSGMADDEAERALAEQMEEWQSRVMELSLEYASGEDGVSDKLRQELNL